MQQLSILEQKFNWFIEEWMHEELSITIDPNNQVFVL